jgi:zinc protease
VALRNPGVIAGDVSSRLVYGATPYGSGLPGERGLTAVTNDEVRAFHQTLWRPDNATLVIAGAMSPDEAFAYAERLFGGWARPSTPAPTLADLDGPPRPPRVVVVDMPQAGQAAVYATIRTGPRADPNFYPLSVANAVLGGGSNGRLFQEVRAKRGLSYGAYSGLSSAREDGRLQASAQTRNDAVAQTVGVIMDEIDRLGREAPDAGAVQRRITFLQGNYGRQIETSSGIAATLAQLAALGLPTEEVTRYPTQIGAVTVEDVARVAGERITSANATVVIVGDGRQFLDALRTRYPQVEVVPFAEIDFDDPDLGLDR